MNCFDKIVGIVGQARGFDAQQIKSAERRAPFVRARYEVAYLARKYLDLSLPEIGRRLNRDHTSVINGLRRIEQRMQSPEYLKEVSCIEDRVWEALQ